MNNEFAKSYRELNPKQREAVDHIEGPLLVVAGPGTGKTQLLSMRIANILRQTDAKPNNILALTFTNKAAVNMKDRIIELAGRDGARVPASTFHSFAAEVMNLYPDNFWNAARLEVAPDSVQLDIIESIVKELPLDNPLSLKFAGQYTLLKAIKNGIGLAKDAGLTPDKLRAIIKFNLTYIDKIETELAELLSEKLSLKKLPALVAEVEGLTDQEVTTDLYPLTALQTVINTSLAQAVRADEELGKCTNTSKWKSRWIQTVNGERKMVNERARNAWWLELAGVYDSYRDELHRRGFYDYSDMLVEVIAQLEQNPAMLADVQERFSYVLIDEFQDSTPAQLRLAHLLAEHYSAEGKPNLMVVGDDDQTIYKFNGAEVNNMLNFEKLYPGVKKIVLTDNYRSAQDILDFAGKVIEQAEVRLVKIDKSLRKDLKSRIDLSTLIDLNKSQSSIRTMSFNSAELQYSGIARDIKKSIAARGRPLARGGPLRSVAVLARSHDSLIRLTGLLEQLKVPVRYEQSANILDHPIIDQTYLMAHLLLAIRRGDIASVNALIHKLLRWPVWGIEPKQLWELAKANFRNPQWLDSMLKSQNSIIKDLGEWFLWLAEQSDNQPLAVTIEQVIGLRESNSFKSPVRDYYLKQDKHGTNEYFHGLSAIQLLRNLAHEFGAEAQPTLADLVRFIDINKTNELIVPDESPFITGAGAVQLLSVHKAKGLEFDDIYIIDAIDDNWRPRAGGRKPPANLPLQPHGDDLDDYVRLMYVAVSRAKRRVTISGYSQDHAGRDVSLSSIIQAVQPFQPVIEDKPAALIPVLEENLRWPELKGGQEAGMLKARLEDFNLNVTHLLSFMNLKNAGPQVFKERHLLRLPEVKTPSQFYGTAIHAALKQAQVQANRGRLALTKVQAEFAKALSQQQMLPQDEKRYLAEGKRLIKRLFQDMKFELPKGSLAEHELRDIRLGDARLAGILDRVDPIPSTSSSNETGRDHINIVDYKTGRPLVSFETRDQNQMLKAWQHRTQLIFYALLMESQRANQEISGEMVYVEADSPKLLSLRYTPTAADKERLARLIGAVWQRIMNLDFPDTSHYPPDLAGVKAFEEHLIGNK
ncbi:ATP-dependent helicase [Candidatus Saccharibacteria bacterium]|nr:ATP-dependent helicase [Candidatus Saccharibacteria bacterium]